MHLAQTDSHRLSPRRLIASAVLGAILSLVAIAAFSPRLGAAEDPRAVVGYVGASGMEALGPAFSPAQRAARFRDLFRTYFDERGLAEFALGRYRWSATPQQHQEFLSLYEEYTVKIYVSQLQQYGAAPFRVTGMRPAAGDITLVTSEIARNDGSRVQVDWTLTDVAGRYKILDVTVGGISMRVTQRNQFAAWIQNNAGRFDALLAVLRQQIRQ